MIYAFIADGFEEIEALSVVDILRRADLDVKTISVTNKLSVCGAHGIEIKTDDIIDNIENYDMIFLPGGYPGYVNLEKSEKLIEEIKKAYSENKYIAAICAAPSILGKLEILKNKSACCFPSFEEHLIGANVSYDDVVVSDKIITSRGAGTAHKLGFKIVELYKGKAFSDKLAQQMIY